MGLAISNDQARFETCYLNLARHYPILSSAESNGRIDSERQRCFRSQRALDMGHICISPSQPWRARTSPLPEESSAVPSFAILLSDILYADILSSTCVIVSKPLSLAICSAVVSLRSRPRPCNAFRVVEAL